MRPTALVLVLAVLLGCSTGASVFAKRPHRADDEVVPLTAFEETLDAKVMPTGQVPEDILNPYPTSSKLVTLKRSINVRVPAIPPTLPEPSVITASISRYDTFDNIMEQISRKLGVDEGDGGWRLVSVETGQVLLARDMGWLQDGATVVLALPQASADHMTGVRVVSVFKNGALKDGVNYRITPHDTVDSIVEATGRHVGIDEAHMADNPSLFDEGGLRLTDADLGWLEDGAKLWIVPAHRYYMWPEYDVGTTIRIQHPESPIPGKQIELTTLSLTPKLLQIDNFLADAEIDHLKDIAAERLEKSVTGANADGTHSHRTSTNAWESSTVIAKQLIHRAFSLARVPYKDNQRDAIQILHYGPSDRYIVHTDWFSAGGYDGWNTSKIGNTNRYATVFFYLNDVEAGGHTVFPRATAEPPEDMTYTLTQDQWDSLPKDAQVMKECKPGAPGIHVPPKKGTAIIFYSSDAFGNLDKLSEHGACPIISGEKWGANVWIWNYKRPPMKSKKNPRAISFSFVNKRDGPVDLAYAPGKGDPDTHFTTIQPEAEYSVTTYAGHTWHMRQHGQEDVLHAFTVPAKKKGIVMYEIE